MQGAPARGRYDALVSRALNTAIDQRQQQRVWNKPHQENRDPVAGPGDDHPLATHEGSITDTRHLLGRKGGNVAIRALAVKAGAVLKFGRYRSRTKRGHLDAAALELLMQRFA